MHEGEDLFHRGEVASLVENLCRDRGGSLGRDDLARYDAEWRRPLAATFRDSRVWLNPPPAASGVLLAFALALLDRRPALTDDVDLYHELAAVVELTHEARLATLAAGQCCPALDALLDAGHLADCLRRMEGFVSAWRGTTHLSVADGSGNLVALSVSNGEGCGEVIPGTGIMFNNMLGEQDLNPGGFHRLPPDVRMSSMMAPTPGRMARRAPGRCSDRAAPTGFAAPFSGAGPARRPTASARRRRRGAADPCRG
ncbi:MAG: gamma-glutamyltransferase [Gammaproteobacteria bacterium]|nr:gamma-glutamyltransferase [Gammaproteobacteria bacterium]